MPLPLNRLPADLDLGFSPARTHADSEVLLARARPSGAFELLTTHAWAGALGYRPDELNGKSLRVLMQLTAPAAREIVAAILDEADAVPPKVFLQCKDGERKCFRLHRRFDAYDQAVILLADEVPAESLEPVEALASNCPVHSDLVMRETLLGCYEASNGVLLAKAPYDGTLRLLTPAWGRLLGYADAGLEDTPLLHLMSSDRRIASNVAAAILDELDMAPVGLRLRCTNGECRDLLLHRRYDSAERAMYIVGEESKRESRLALMTPA